MKNDDINSQIDRILSSNIRNELLNHIPLELLQSPCVQKKYVRQEKSSASSKQSFSRQMFEEDLYEKAQQIIKLKETLEAELSNINQIVEENQKLTEANLHLEQELKKIKTEWKNYKLNINNQLKLKDEQIHRIKQQNIQALQKASAKQIIKANKNELVSQVATLKLQGYLSSFQQQRKAANFELNPQTIVLNIEKLKDKKCHSFSQTQSSFQQIEISLENLKKEVHILTKENLSLKTQINALKQTYKKNSAQNSKILQQKSINQQPPIQCYTSVFLKSVFSQPQNKDHIICNALFSLQKPFFQQLEESKYFGKIVLGKKNGKAIEQYTNGFSYEGNFSKNHRHGMGRLYYKDKLVYAGQWKKGKFDGKGLLLYFFNLQVSKIEGNFKNGFLQGHSTISLKSGQKIRAVLRKNNLISQAMILGNQNVDPNTFTDKSQIGNFYVQRSKTNSIFFQKISIHSDKGQTIDLQTRKV